MAEPDDKRPPPSIATEHYAKAVNAVDRAQTMLGAGDPASDIQATIGLTHAIIAETNDRGYLAERLIHVIEELTSAIRVHGS